MPSMTRSPALDDHLARSLAALDRAGLRRVLPRLEARHGVSLLVQGRPVIDFSSNDYLGLASDPAVIDSVRLGLLDGEVGAGSARLISGNRLEHDALERELADFKGAASALLFGSGYLANLGTLPALADQGDGIYADGLNHASLIDACRLSRATTLVYPHADPAALRTRLAESAHRFRRRWIVTDGVFSMDGDIAPLRDLLMLAHEYEAWVYVDDAHGTGVLGEGGRGTVEHWGLCEGPPDVVMGTLGKALGVSGAFVTGTDTLVEYLRHRARTFVYTTGTPAPLARATRTALERVRTDPQLRNTLRGNVSRLRSALADRGIAVGGDPATPILPVRIGGSEATASLGSALLSRGFLVGAIRSPTVPVNQARLRITVSAAHTGPQLDALAEVLGELMPTARTGS